MSVLTGHKDDLEVKRVSEEAAHNTMKRIVYSPVRNWDTHVMRIFTMGDGGRTKEHEHAWPHWVFVLEGKGNVTIAGERFPLERGSYVHVPGGLRHFFENTQAGGPEFEFMCIVPKEGDMF
ncbi:MAG: cupin domain-containing protein [Dehalococcoidales bacterium]|nr:cupin domain-containing protein [Dehalococcoidales bacterium]